MIIQVEIKTKTLEQAIGYHLDLGLYDEFNKGILKTAKVPSKKVLVEAVLADKKFVETLVKHVTSHVRWDADYIYEAMWHIFSVPAFSKIIKECEKLYVLEDKDRIEESLLKESIKRLEAAGYTVTPKN